MDLPEMPPLITLPVTKNLTLLCFRSWLPHGPYFAVREVDYKILRASSNQKKGGKNSGVFAGPTEQAIRAGIRQTILNHNLNSAAATKGEIAMLKEQGILGRRAPSCALLAADDMASLLATFGKEQLAQQLMAAVAKFRKENPPSDHVVYSLAMPKPREPAVQALPSLSRSKGKEGKGAGSPAEEGSRSQQLSARYSQAADLVSKLAAVIQGSSSSSRKRPREQLGLERQPAPTPVSADAAPIAGEGVQRRAGISALLAAVNGESAFPSKRPNTTPAAGNPDDNMPDAAPAPSTSSTYTSSASAPSPLVPAAGSAAAAGASVPPNVPSVTNVQYLPVPADLDKVEQHRAQLRSLRSLGAQPPLKRARVDPPRSLSSTTLSSASASASPAAAPAVDAACLTSPSSSSASSSGEWAGSPLEALVKAAFPSPTPSYTSLVSSSSSSSSFLSPSPSGNTPLSNVSSSASGSSSGAPQQQQQQLPPSALSALGPIIATE